MGLPNINITFETRANSAVRRSQKGIVAIILKDSKLPGGICITSAAQIPATLTKTNQEYIARAFEGYVNAPSKVIVYVLPTSATDLTDALKYFETQTFDYLVGPPDCTSAYATAIAAFIKSKRADDFTPKAVLPDTASDSEGVVNFAAAGIVSGAVNYTAAQYCSRIAGLIAGTPLAISCTFAPLPEVSDITRLSKSDSSAAIDAGKLILYHDGEKVKIARGVNSLVTTAPDKGESFKKIKIVETIDMIKSDIKQTAQDSYIGKYANSYDNKCLLITAISGYFGLLEKDGLLAEGRSFVGIDTDAVKAYLTGLSQDVSGMNEQQLKEADTGDKVFLNASVKILDAIEDVDLKIVL